MSDMKKKSFKTNSWREVLKENQRKTYLVILSFILLYLIIGFIVNVIVIANMYGYGIDHIVVVLITFKIIPYITIIFGAVALISIWIALLFNNKIMLFGTKYIELNLDKKMTLEEKKVYNVVEEMKIAAGMKYMPKVYLIEANYMNAFASGYNEKNAMVAVTKGLVETLTRDELAAVIAHEITHIRHQDIKLTLVASILSNIMLIVIDVLFWTVLFSDDDNSDSGIILIVVILLRYLLPLISLLLMLFLSRTREYMADAGAVELTRNNDSLAKALIKISDTHINAPKAHTKEYQKRKGEYFRQQAYIFDPQQVGIKPSKSIAELFSTHPNLEHRLEKLGYNYEIKKNS